MLSKIGPLRGDESRRVPERRTSDPDKERVRRAKLECCVWVTPPAEAVGQLPATVTRSNPSYASRDSCVAGVQAEYPS